MPDVRNAPRALVTIPTLVEKVGQQPISPDPGLVPHFERVSAHGGGIGAKVPGIIRDLSVNGVFIAAQPFPLLSRVSFTFPLTGYGQVDAIGWVFWRRSQDVTVRYTGREAAFLPAGIGVLFESVPIDARIAIAQIVASAVRAAP